MRFWFTLLLALAASAANAADLPHAWVQFVASGGLEVRAIVGPGMKCPVVLSGQNPLTSVVRAEPTEAYPIQVCATPVPPGAGQLTANGLALPAMPKQIRRVAIIGDTGCRMKGTFVQDCNDPAAWPFSTVARLVGGRKPDIVIHVGDYHYRESACPTDRPGCAGSPFGDNWAVWQKDMFNPIDPLLPVAPFVFARGNHELCERGGKGWFHILDAYPSTACRNLTDPYTLFIGPLTLSMLDSATADDQKADPKMVPVYTEHLKALYAQSRPGSWLVTHRPIYAYAQGSSVPAGATTNATLQAAMAEPIPANVAMILSGHIHSFMSYEFAGARPSQLVVGESGDASDEITNPLTPGKMIAGLPIKRGFGLGDYGYAMAHAVQGGWDVTVYSITDKALARCALRGRGIHCRPTKR